jgi:hypothetical protein
VLAKASATDYDTEWVAGGGGGSGDVVGPAGATDGAVPLFDGVTGKLLQDGPVPGAASGLATLTAAGFLDEPIHHIFTVLETRDPTANDDFLDGLTVGSTWANTSTGATFFCFAPNPGAAVWVQFDLTKTLNAVQPGDPISINAQTGTTYTLVLADQGKLVTLDNGAAITVTIPTNAAVALPVGTVIAFAQLGAGAVSIEGDTGVTVNATSGGSEALSAQYATASATKLATDTWLVSGGLT